jgi:hypothetical protein
VLAGLPRAVAADARNWLRGGSHRDHHTVPGGLRRLEIGSTVVVDGHCQAPARSGPTATMLSFIAMDVG